VREMDDRRKIGVVGPCAAGKSTLIAGLKKLGYDTRHIAQEHSYAPHMWKRITDPDVLIYLDVSYEESMKRRRLDWTPADHEKQQQRLENARQNADLYLNTDTLTKQEVYQKVKDFLEG
jgi:deoxyadenosine/deoxycytidine kinase